MPVVNFEATAQRAKPGVLCAPQNQPVTDDHDPSVAGFSSSLVSGNLSVEKPPSDSPASGFRFRHHAHERQKLLEAVPLLDLSEKHQARFASCGTDAWIQFSSSTGRFRVVATSCKLKWCPHCCRARSKNVADAIGRLLDTAHKSDWRFLTLTARHVFKPLEDQVAELKAAFRRMRQRKAWKTHVNYGIAVIETTWNDETKRWHPHLHVLIMGIRFPKAIIRSEWLHSTRNSYIVHIRRVGDKQKDADYCAKYMGKPPDDAVLTDVNLLKEWIDANVASKRIIRFGKPPPVQPPPEKDDGVMDWEPVHKLDDIIEKAQRGDVYASHLMALLTENDCGDDQPAAQNRAPPKVPGVHVEA